jgi:acyl dehydratase
MDSRVHPHRTARRHPVFQDKDVAVEVGMDVELEHTFGPEAVQTFAALSGDDNPIHLDHAYATKQVGRRRSCVHIRPVSRHGTTRPLIHLPPAPQPHQGIFKGAIVHGLLVGSLFGTIFGVTFPGCVYLQQSFKVGE